MPASTSTDSAANSGVNSGVDSGAQPLGLTTLVMLVVASMIGIGCFFSSGYSLLALGNPNRVILAWILCGVWALAGSIAYGALARRVPLSGGEYLYLSRLMHPSIGFLAGWISLVAGFTAPIAAMAKAVVTYALPAAGQEHWASLCASLIILIACVLHAARVQLGATVQNAIVFVKLLFIAGLLAWAGLQLDNSQVWQGGPLPERSSDIWPGDTSGVIALLAAMSWLSLSYTGFNAAVYVAGESQAAQRNVPRAMIGATVLVMILYVLMNAVFVWAAPTLLVQSDPGTIGLSAARSFGPIAELTLRIIVSLAVLSSVFGMLMAGPRVYAQMARDGVMPRFLDTAGGVPRLAIWLQGLLSIVIIWFARLEQLIGYLGMTLAACSTLAVSSLWLLQWFQRPRPPGQAMAKLTPLELGSSIVYCLGTVAMLLAVLIEGKRLEELWAMLATFVIGAIVYILWQVSGVGSLVGQRRLEG